MPMLDPAASAAPCEPGHPSPVARPGPGARSAEARGAAATGAEAVGALAIGAIALGAMALGAVAIGAFSIGRLSARRVVIDDARLHRLRIDHLTIGSLDDRRDGG